MFGSHDVYVLVVRGKLAIAGDHRSLQLRQQTLLVDRLGWVAMDDVGDPLL